MKVLMSRFLLAALVLSSCCFISCSKGEFDVLKFQSFQFKKQNGPAFIAEGAQSTYTVLMDGPPDTDVTLELATAVNGFIETLTERLTFNSTNWNESREIYILGVDDNVIRYSPYGGVLNINSTSSNSSYSAAVNLTLLVADTDTSGVIIVRKEQYPFPTDIPEGRWAVYNVTLPSKPTHLVTITFHTLTDRIALHPDHMVFQPETWNDPQDLVVYALEDSINALDSPYPVAFQMTLTSHDFNYDQQAVPNYNLTVEDNDEDAAVISGNLVWRRVSSGFPRTKAQFTLSLTLDHSYYNNVTVGSQISMPGKLMFGDEIETTDLIMTVYEVNDNEGYISAEGTVLHQYSMAHYYGNPWVATYEYCCRSKLLKNNKGSKLALSVTVDLTHNSSPLVPSLPLVIMRSGQGRQYMYYSAIAILEHSVSYTFGDAIDYRSVQAGTPQGIEIIPITGHMTWNTDHVTPGDYSVQLVTKDINTNLRVASELRIRVMPTHTMTTNSNPSFPVHFNLLPPDVIYVNPGKEINYTLSVINGDNVSFLTPTPRGFIANITDDTLTVVWSVAGSQPEGPVIVCMTAIGGNEMSSLPLCLSFIVTNTLTKAFSIDLNGPTETTNIYHQSYIHGLDTSVPLTSFNATVFVLSPLQPILHMTVFFASHYDGINETLSVVDYSHPSLTITHTSDTPRALLVTGEAIVGVYMDLLKHVHYSNSKGHPTVGSRIIGVKLYTGLRSNSLHEAYINMTVTINNNKPILGVNGLNSLSYSNRFYPHNNPVPTYNTSSLTVADSDSISIERATVTLLNPLNGASEVLQVTYASPESLSLPIVLEELDVNVPLGQLFSGQIVRKLSRTLSPSADSSGLVVGSVEVIVDIRHSWIGDLKLELEHNHHRVLLVLSPGGKTCSHDNLFATTFGSTASDEFTLSKNMNSPGLCVFQTQGLFSPDESLDGFKGLPIEGEWTLHITDLLTSKDNGRLVSWGIVIRTLEDHLIVSSPPVAPVVTVRQQEEERHYRRVDADGRITSISVSVHLAIPFTAATISYLPTLKLIHPDGTQVVLSSVEYPLCAYGNFSYVVFDDRSSSDYSCLSLYNISSMGSGGSNSSGDFSSGSASGDGVAFLPTLTDVINMNITVPVKDSLIDILVPHSPLSVLYGKQLTGQWTLLVSSNNELESTLIGWSLRIAREANIDSQYIGNTLTLTGSDSPFNYQTVLKSIVYSNTHQWPDFSAIRHIQTVLYDGQSYSNSILPQSQSYITIHHIIIDLDPFNTNYAVSFQEHSKPIPLVNNTHALLRDEGSLVGLYSLIITIRNYSNIDMEGLMVDTFLLSSEGLFMTQYDVESNEELRHILNISTPALRSITIFEKVLRTIEYYNNAEELLGLSRSVEFNVQDTSNGNRYISTTAITSVEFIFTNDLPLLVLNPISTGAPYVVSYEEGQGTVLLTNETLISLTDNDDEYLQSLTVTISNAYDSASEFLDIDRSILEMTAISYYYNLSTHTLTLSGEDTLDNYTLILTTLTYNNTVHSPGRPNPTTRVVYFVPYDGKDQGRPAITMISFTSVNDAPFGDLNGLIRPGINNSVTFIEEKGSLSLIDSAAVILDVDNTSLSYFTVTIINPLDGEREILTVRNVTERAPESNDDVLVILQYFPQVSYDVAMATLTVTGLNTVYEYQEVLKTLSYNNLADEPDPTTRLIEITLNDGLIDSNPLLYSIINMELINDSPYFDTTSGSSFSHVIQEDEVTNGGILLSTMAYLILDDDSGSVPGIGLVSVDMTNGRWEFMIPDDSVWYNVWSNVSLTNALVLSASSSARLRFVPDRDFNGRVNFTIVAWDGTDGVNSGAYVNATSTSAIDSFSSHLLDITVIVQPVNDAPVLYDIPLNFTAIQEDDYNSTGDTVLDLLQYAHDVDIPLQQTELGIAVTYADKENGVWQYSQDGGDSWTPFGTVNVSSALLLESLPQDMNRIRFVPNTDFNGYSMLQFKAWDLSYDGLITENREKNISIVSGSGSSSGSGMSIQEPFQYPLYVDTSLSDTVTGPLSVNATSVTLHIEPVNDSPVVSSGMTMMSITEDLSIETNHGTSVDYIINKYYIDVDAFPDKGLAIVQVDNRYGRWQYTCGSPSNVSSWTNFIGDVHYGQIVPPLPLVDKATLLSSSCWIRFLPDIHFNTELDYSNRIRPYSDTPFIVAYGWDNTGITQGLSGSYGNDATYANASITNEYSANTITIPISIISINDVPILYLTNTTVPLFNTIFYEDLPSVAAVGKDLTLIDNDHSRLYNATITLYGQYDTSPFNDNDIDEFIAEYNEELSLIGSGSGNNNSNNVSTELRYIDYLRLYVLNQTDPSIDELYCAGLNPRREELFIDTQYTDLISLITSWCPFTLTIYPNPLYDLVDTDKTQFQKVLRTLHYNNSIQEPLGPYRTISFLVSDGVGYSSIVNSIIEIELINDAPILDINDYIPDINNYVIYTEGGSPLILVNSTGLRLVDFDNDYLQNATIVLLNAPDTINETLSANTTGTNINAVYTNYTLYLTGNDTVETYAQVLTTVSYVNKYAYPGNPDQSQRSIIFTVSDGTKISSPAVSFVTFIGVNDRPMVDVNGAAFGSNYSVQFREEEGPVSVVSPLGILTDEDNVTLQCVTARILNPLDGDLEMLEVDSIVLENVLQRKFINFNKVVQVTNLVPNVTYNTSTSTLYISGLDSVYEYKLILRTLTYDNIANEIMNASRVIEFIANDGLLDSHPSYTTVEMIPINDSPYFNKVPIIVPHIFEDDTTNIGNTVYDIASPLIEDYDSQYQSITKGIAVINMDTDNGDWYYRLSPTSLWELFPNDTALNRAVLLTASVNNSIRFVPQKDFNGNVSLTFVAWDGVDELPDGHVRVATSNNGTDPFSTETRTLTVVVVPVNDAPVINSSMTVIIPPILEDDVIDRPSLGEDISLLLETLIDDVDQPIDTHQFGVAITEVDQTNGLWQYSTDNGTNWNNLTSLPSLTNALVLHTQPSGTHRIRFAPNLNFNGLTSLKFKLWDMNTTYPSGLQGVDTDTNVITGTFSREVATATLQVEPVNDSPVLDPNPMLPDIREDISSFSNVGTEIRVMINFVYSDVDVGNDKGIAVVGTYSGGDDEFGHWQYTCDDFVDTEWLPFIGDYQFGQIAPRRPLPQKATLLLESCRVRFVPATNFNTQFDSTGAPRSDSDIPYILIKGWDNTGSTRGYNLRYGIDTTTDDHTNSFSADTQQVNITVISVNDRPILNLNGTQQNYQTTFIERYPQRSPVPVSIVNPLTLNLTDVDDSNITLVSVSFERYDISYEHLLINISGTTLNYTIIVLGTTYQLSLRPQEGSAAPIGEFQSVLKTLMYENSADEPNPMTRVLTFYARDSSSFSSPSRTTLFIELINDPPIIDLNVYLNESYNFINYTEGQGPGLLLDETSISLTDTDNTSLQYISVTLTVNPDGNNEVLTANATNTSLVVSFANGTLLIEGPGLIEEFLSVLSTVSYINYLSHPGAPSDDTRTIDIVVSDGLNTTSAAVYLSFTAVNNRPILDVNGNQTGLNYHTVFHEQELPVSAVAEDTVLVDIDHETLAYIQVTIENPLDGGNHEKLWVRNVTEYKGDPNGLHYSVWNFRPNQYYNSTTATLTISGLETVYEYQQVLKTLTYNNSANEPHNQTRVLSFIVSDGETTRSGVTTNIDIININDSPYINTGAPLYHPMMEEDVDNESNIGWSLESIASANLLDDDDGAVKGVAIISVDTQYGTWEYTTDYTASVNQGGIIDSIMSMISSASGMTGPAISGSGDGIQTTTWKNIPSNSTLSYATVLQINGNATRIRFVPTRDFNGNVSFSFVGWDSTNGLNDGSITDATSLSRTDPFSTNSVSIIASVVPVNDAPLLINDTIYMTSILEDDYSSSGDPVSLFISGISDVDTSDIIYGIAITGADASNGVWQFTADGGYTWISILTPSLDNALLLSSIDGTRIRFLPFKDYNGHTSLTFHAWDQTAGHPTSYYDITTSDSVIGSFSTSDTDASLYIEPVNDSPVIRPGMNLTTLLEDDIDNEGDTVADIANSVYYTDVDDNSQTGLAVVGVDVRNGIWQYKCPSAKTWSTFIGNVVYGIIVPLYPRPERATLLAADCRIRFVPNLLFNTEQYLDGTPRPLSETPYIKVRGWDNTGVSSGRSNHYGIDTSYNNISDINEFSSETERVLISVTSVNNLPVLSISSEGDSYTVTFTEDDPYVRIVDPNSVSITDLDHVNLESIEIVIENVYDQDDETLSFVIPPNVTDLMLNDTLGTVTILNDNNTESINLTLSFSSNQTSLLLESVSDTNKVSIQSYVKVLRYLVYSNTHSEPVNITRFVQFHVDDSEDINSLVTTSIQYRLLAENHPILTTYLYNISFTEGDPSPIPLVSNNLTLTDLDHNEFFYISRAELTLDPIPVDPLEYLSVDTIGTSIIATYNDSDGTLLITGDEPIGAYQSILRTLTYHNTIDEPLPGVRTVTISVTDDHGLRSNVEVISITVSVINDQTSVIITPTKPIDYIEHRTNIQPSPVLLSTNLSVSDADSGDFPLIFVSIELTDPLNNITEEILSVTPVDTISVDYTNSTLLLTGPASIADFNTALSTLTYINIAEEPIMEERVLELIAYDGIHYSDPVTITVNVITINDAPVIDLNGPEAIDINYMIEYKEGSGFVPIVAQNELVIYDYDNDYLTQLQVIIDIPYDSPNEILQVTHDDNDSSISVSYNATTGLLLLSGNATVTEYQSIIRTITYAHLEAKPGHPNTSMRRIIFTVYDRDNSSISAITYLTFASVNDPPMIDLNGDTPGVNYTVSFIEEGDPVYLTDRNMTLVDIDSTTLYEIRCTILNCLDGDLEDVSLVNDTDLPVTLSAISETCRLVISGFGLVEEFHTVLSMVTYTNNADEPHYTPRIIEVIADDGFNKSTPVYTIVSILPVNDPPVLRISKGAFSFGANVDLNTGQAPDIPYQSGSGSGSMTSGSGNDYNSSMPMTTPTTTPLERITVEMNLTTADYLTVYVENGPSVPIVQSQYVQVTDEDNVNLKRLQVTLQNELDIGHEAIFFNKQDIDSIPDVSIRNALNVVLGAYVRDGCPLATQTHYTYIDLELLLTLEQMNYTIKSLHYCNTDDNPFGDNRTITFRVQDPAGAWSNVETTIVQIAVHNDAPIYSPPPSFNSTLTTLEDHNISIPVFNNFFDHEETLTPAAIRVLDPMKGTAIVNQTTGAILYIPVVNDYGIWIIMYQACDSLGACSPVQNLTIIIESVNDPPYVVGKLTFEIIEDITSIFNLTRYFRDPEDDTNSSLPFPLATYKSGGTILEEILIANNQLNITSSNRNGQDDFILELCDSERLCIDVTVNVTVLPVNDLPEVVINYPYPLLSYAVIDEDVSLNLTVTIYDIESSIATPITVSVVDTRNGSVTIAPLSLSDLTIVPASDPVVHRRNGLKQDIYLTYTPRFDFNGRDSFVISANDTEGGYVETIINIDVTPINDSPQFGITAVNTGEDTPLVLNLPYDLNVTDPEDILTAESFSIVQNPLHGTLKYSISTGQLVYTPNSEYFSTSESPEYFIIRACDNHTSLHQLCTDVTIYVSVSSTNDIPVLTPFTVSVYEDHSVRFNLSNHTYDVEDITPPMSLISIIDPRPRYGSVTYNPSTGIATYIPNNEFSGIDYVYFESCDTDGHCSSINGNVTVVVLEVNDPPTATSFSHVAMEDDFDLIDIFSHTDNGESSDSDLKIILIDPNTDQPLSGRQGTTLNGASLKIFQTYGIITYEPAPNFIGYDNFTFMVCDSCDPNRQEELGRVVPNDECQRQIEVAATQTAALTCARATVSVTVTNVGDVPIIRGIVGVVSQGGSLVLDPFTVSRYTPPGLTNYFYSNSSALVYDIDDSQAVYALSQGFNLTLFNLQSDTNIDELSLRQRSQANGSVQTLTSNGAKYFMYTPSVGFGGYDSFVYEICDLMSGDDVPFCVQTTANIYVTRPGPTITSVTAISPTDANGNDTDSKVSRGDRIIITFSEDTSMPPYRNTTAILSTNDIDILFEFPDTFIPSQYVSTPYFGQWLSPKELSITIEDEGYPQPESRVGDWRIAVRSTTRTCGGFNDDGSRATIDDFCLLSADNFSIPSTSVSPTLSGNWGLRLPELNSIVLSNVGVDDEMQKFENTFQFSSQIKIVLEQPLSYSQLQFYCGMDPRYILNTTGIADNMTMVVLACNNNLPNGSKSEDIYQTLIQNTLNYFPNTLSSSTRTRRQAVTVVTPVQPLVSEITLRVISYNGELKVDPVNDPFLFTREIEAGFNRSTLAYVVNHLLGVNIEALDSYDNDVPRRSIGTLYTLHDNTLTPRITSITADDPGCLHTGLGNGDTITITFNTPTNTPPVSSKQDIDRIFVFDPSLGTDYSGSWSTPSILVITLTNVGSSLLTTSNFSLSFKENRFYDGSVVTSNNTIYPTLTPQCIGANVCSNNGSQLSVGVCSANNLSCRAYEPFTSTLDGDFGGGSRCTAVLTTQLDWLWVLIAALILIAIAIIAILVFYCYRRYKQKKQREEAMRVVKRWEKDKVRYDVKKESEKKDDKGVWVKPPDVHTMRDTTDPFSDDPLRNLPRPPTAANENLPPIDTIPKTFIPRAGGRVAPLIPSMDGSGLAGPMSNNRISTGSLHSLTPLGLPRLTNLPRQPSLTPTGPPQLAPLRGPLHLYGQKALGETSPEESGAPKQGGMLPGALVPKQLPPIGPMPVRRSLSNLGPPILPPISEQKATPITSSDENVNSTSETDGGGTTSEGGGANRLETRPLRRPLPSQQSLPGIPRPPLLSRTPTQGTLPPITRQPTQTSLPPLPSMPMRRTSVDPFATPPPLLPRAPPTMSRPGSQASLMELRRPVLPSIPPIVREEDPVAITTEAEIHTSDDNNTTTTD